MISREYGWTDDQILDLTLARMRQIRDIVALRRSQEWKRDVRIQERIMQNLMASTYAAAGSKKGANAASASKLIPDDDTAAAKEHRIPSVQTVSRVFAVDSRYGMFTQEEIDAEAERQRTALADAA